jgi:hypothetical protein
MPYVKTGKPNGRPRKSPPADAVEQQDPKPVRRVRKVFKQPPSRRYVSASAPSLPAAPADTTPPMFGQRPRAPQRRPALIPTPLKA